MRPTGMAEVVACRHFVRTERPVKRLVVEQASQKKLQRFF